MAKFGLRKLLKSTKSDCDNENENDVASSEITNDTDVDEKPKTGETSSISNDNTETDEQNELFSASMENEGDNNEPKSAKDSEDKEEDLHKILEDIEIPDFSMSISMDSEEEVNATETSIQESTIDYGDQLNREEDFSKRYRPSKSECKELEDLAERLRVNSSIIQLTTCQNTLHELLFGKHSIILKKGPVYFNNQDCELFLLTDGFIAVYQNVNKYNPLESRYDTCQLWSAVEFVEVANFGALKIQMQSGESFETRCISNGEDLQSWLKAIEHVSIFWTIHSSKSSTMTDVFGWQYQLIRKPAYTTAVMTDMKLMGNPTNLNELDDYNQSSPLHYAIQHEPCSADIVDALLRAGADPNLPDGEGRSAMYYAQRNNLSDIEGIMKEYGGKKSKLADIELKGELFGGVDEAKRKTDRRREIEQAVKDNKAAEVATKTQSAQSQMSQNMNAMIERGEKINAMDNKAQQLNDEAKNYRKLASQLKDQAKNRKWYQF